MYILINELKKGINAFLNEEKGKKKKEEIKKAFEQLEQENKEDEKMKETINKKKKELIELVNKKVQLQPTLLYYYKTGGRVSVKVALGTGGGYRYTIGNGNKIRQNRGKDREKYDLIVSASYVEDFLWKNEVDDKDILIDPRSVDVYYSFYNEISHNLTPSFVSEWYNHDCPSLYRYTVNKEKATNLLGEPIPHFTTNLIEVSWSNVYVDKSITEKEAKALTQNNPDTWVTQEVNLFLKAQKLKNNKERMEEIKNFVKNYDAAINQVIKENEEKIFEKMVETFACKNAKYEDGIFEMDDDFGLDCGFIYVYTTDENYNKQRSILKNAGYVNENSMEISFPYFTQSTTVQREQFDIIKEIVNKETGIKLYANTELD